MYVIKKRPDANASGLIGSVRSALALSCRFGLLLALDGRLLVMLSLPYFCKNSGSCA